MENPENFYKKLLDDLYDAVYFVDKNRRITYWNKSAEALTGYSADEVVNKFCSSNILNHVNDQGDQLCQINCPLSQTLIDKKPRELNVFLHHKQGHRIPVCVKISPIFNDQQTIIGAVEIFHSNSDRLSMLEHIEELKKLSMMDALTKIANRHYLEKSIDIRIEELKRYNWPFALIFLDIDDFKKINDQMGHSTGDKALIMVATTIQNNIRSSDLVGRWGGEEFVVVMRNVNVQQLQKIAEKIRALIAASAIYDTPSSPLQLTVSGGATLATANDSLQSIVSRADQLMYHSKKSQKNKITFG
jgi:diguanylate cyclase (GGDEF)-like protein/PAS domain S-box-containing protein